MCNICKWASAHPRGSQYRKPFFDFFKDRTKEGLDQLSNLAYANYKGKLGKGLVDVALYTKETNEKFASGLAKTRQSLLYYQI